MIAVLFLAIVLPLLLAAAFLLGRCLARRSDRGLELSAVTRQHIDLFQGGQLNEAAVEMAKARFRDLLERGEVRAVEASLRPGTQFVIQVRALAELGTEDAGGILERQLQRRLTDDVVEQSWYWIDLANGLRSLNRQQSLPQLLRCAEAAAEVPLGHFLAAETVCFLGFPGYLSDPEAPQRDQALRVLHRALEGLHCGVQPTVVAEARLGELIETLWDHRLAPVHPLEVRIFREALRLLRRAPHAELVLKDERAEVEAFSWQISRLAALEPLLTEYLEEAGPLLVQALLSSSASQHREILLALTELRAEAAFAVLPLLARGDYPLASLAVLALTWSKDRRVGPWLREWAHRRLALDRRIRSTPRPTPPRRPSVPDDLPYRAILHCLRGHGSPETEAFLLGASQDWDPTYRAAALSSLGWWEPFHRGLTLTRLDEARRDPNPEVRQMARAALARLGERLSLHWFRQRLSAEEPQRIHEAMNFVATEGILLLWPDLDRLADSEDTDVAFHAREALERLREDMNLRPF